MLRGQRRPLPAHPKGPPLLEHSAPGRPSESHHPATPALAKHPCKLSWRKIGISFRFRSHHERHAHRVSGCHKVSARRRGQEEAAKFLLKIVQTGRLLLSLAQARLRPEPSHHRPLRLSLRHLRRPPACTRRPAPTSRLPNLQPIALCPFCHSSSAACSTTSRRSGRVASGQRWTFRATSGAAFASYLPAPPTPPALTHRQGKRQEDEQALVPLSNEATPPTPDRSVTFDGLQAWPYRSVMRSWKRGDLT